LFTRGYIIAGWWYTNPSEKYEFVSLANYSQYMEKNMFQTTSQHGIFSKIFLNASTIRTLPPETPLDLRLRAFLLCGSQ